MTRLSSLGQWFGPAGRANPNKEGRTVVASAERGRARRKELSNKFGRLSFALMYCPLRPVRPVLVVQSSSVRAFHAGGVTPSLTLLKRKAFTDVSPSESVRGGGNSACQKNADRGAPARQGAGSYPAPTSAVPSRQRELPKHVRQPSFSCPRRTIRHTRRRFRAIASIAASPPRGVSAVCAVRNPPTYSRTWGGNPPA